MKKLIKLFTRRKNKKVKIKVLSDFTKLPECDYDGMGNFSRRGRP